MTDFLLLVAAEAGGADPTTVDGVAAVLARAGSVQRARVGGREDLAAALDALGERVPVVAGGDGALHHVIAALDDRGGLDARAVGLVPMGTANDLARSTGVPLNPGTAARRIAAGQGRRLALATGDLGTFCNAAHAGIGVRAAEAADRLKRRLRWRLGALPYALGALPAGLSASTDPVVVAVDGRALWGGAALLVGVGVGRTVGGGQPLFSAADPADEQLDVVVVAGRGPLGRARLADALRRGEVGDLAGAVTARGAEVTVAGGPRRWDVDGELVDAGRSVRIGIRPGAWRLLGASRSDGGGR